MRFYVLFFLIAVASVAGLFYQLNRGKGTAGVHGLQLTPEQKVKAKKHTSECIEQTGVNVDLIKKARKGTFVEDEKLKKFALCFFLKANLVTPQAELKEDVIMAKLPPGASKLGAKVVLEICKTQKDKTPEGTAWLIFKCYYEATPNHVTLF